MTTNTKVSIAGADRWKRLWHWMRAIDDAFDYDETKQMRASLKYLDQRMSRLEAKLERL